MQKKDFTYKVFDDGRVVEATAFWEAAPQGSGPPSSENNSRPIALLFHGGGFVIGSRLMTTPEHIQDLVAAGFVVVSADYSLCPQVSLHDGPLQDARSAYAWCKTELPAKMAVEDVKVDPARVVVVGYSAGATLALCLGAERDPPVAILDFYGPKCLQDPFWHQPLPAFSQLPDFGDAFINKIFDEPALTSTATSLEEASRATDDDDDDAQEGNDKSNQQAREEGQKPKGGLPMPDFSKPRNAWLFTKLKMGTQIAAIVPDGDYDRVDPYAMMLSATKFPPTCFVHGDADAMVDYRFSARAHQRLGDLGVATELVTVPGVSHGFDVGLSREDPAYALVTRAFDFVGRYAKAR